ncbi:MAG TPA: hypothetical protein VLE22_03595 [Bryobacteraceae bacterium]|nr:hypothetical protein [Bryobacteraceae bacterium]
MITSGSVYAEEAAYGFHPPSLTMVVTSSRISMDRQLRDIDLEVR